MGIYSIDASTLDMCTLICVKHSAVCTEGSSYLIIKKSSTEGRFRLAVFKSLTLHIIDASDGCFPHEDYSKKQNQQECQQNQLPNTYETSQKKNMHVGGMKYLNNTCNKNCDLKYLM